MSETCTGHALPLSCVRACTKLTQPSYVRTCAMHIQALLCLLAVLAHASDVQATLCLSAVFVHARCKYRQCSYRCDTCTGHDLPYSCVRTCAMHAQATLCLTAVFVHARCMYRPRSAFQLCSHMRGMRGRRSARRMQSVCCTRMDSPLAHDLSACARKRAHGGGNANTRTWQRC